MANDRSRYGLLVSALGAVLLVISVFLPWYAVNLTPDGASFAADAIKGLAGEFGNESMQQLAAGVNGTVASMSGHEVAALTAHQVLHDLNVILLLLAGIALMDSLVTLARGTGSAGAGRTIALLGVVAAVCVIYRMAVPPVPPGGLVALSLREGSWLALLGSLMMVLGPIWPRVSVEPAHGASLIRV
jgi:hypothetical protein